jgi:hypothetical protein
MSYEFSVNAKKGILLTLGFLGLGALIFTAGWMSHAYFHPGQPGARMAGGSVSQGASGSAYAPRVSLGSRPSVQKPAVVSQMSGRARSAVSRPESLIRRGAARTGTRQAPVQSGSAAPSPEGQADEGQTADASQEQEAQTSGPDGLDSEPITETRSGSAMRDAPGGEGPKSVRFVVEVERFALKQKAEDQVVRLKEKGYDACFLNMPSSENQGTPWYLVYIGDFDHLNGAYAVASDYEAREKTVAVIRSMKPHTLELRKGCGGGNG